MGVAAEKEKVVLAMEKKTKSVLSAYAIAKSTAINKGRLEKVKMRTEAIHLIEEEAERALKSAGSDKAFITKLIVQGALILLEKEVEVRCRQSDVSMVESILSDASATYAKQIESETGV